jgi:hypothetical protein
MRTMHDINLNELPIPNPHTDWSPTADLAAASRNAQVKVYFRGIKEILRQRIERADLIVGCVAWLTDEDLIRSLCWPRHGVAIVVQAEEFLDPGWARSEADARRAAQLRGLYSHLKMPLRPEDFGGLLAKGPFFGYSHRLEPIRCAGAFPGVAPGPAPRMHHKFLVFCDVASRAGPEDPAAGGPTPPEIRPAEVWVGSFNLTRNAARSLEDVLAIVDPRIATCFYDEWMQIEAISQPLPSDWTMPWIPWDER